jgi:hypothetical protein
MLLQIGLVQKKKKKKKQKQKQKIGLEFLLLWASTIDIGESDLV